MKYFSKGALPITREEFSRELRKSRPPTGWLNSIAVANSGGPDSTCILFLLHRYLQDAKARSNDLREVFSVTVDHGLQEASTDMAKHCENAAKSMGVQHITSKVPWGEGHFPPRPLPGQAIEETARIARYQLLYNAMTQFKTNVIAFGHHGDDQVETALMRLARGSTEYGASGMRRCRRWGMGVSNDEDSVGFAGYEGLNRWIVRPMLEFGKDRILATCEENDLAYVVDKTNFQPELSLRNAIRQKLQNEEKPSPESEASLPAEIAEDFKHIDLALTSLGSVSVDLSSGYDHLRSVVKFLNVRVEDLETEADSVFKRYTLPSPPGTFLMSSRSLSTVRDEEVRRTMVLRILRYISFHPWGSLRANSNRRHRSIQQIREKLWDPLPFNHQAFVAGGGVAWMPVVIKPGNHFKIVRPRFDEQATAQAEATNAGWLAFRQNPYPAWKMKQWGIYNSLEKDITERLRSALACDAKTVDILYDCRFLVRFNLLEMPEDSVESILDKYIRVLLRPNTRWYWPKVVFVKRAAEMTVHSQVSVNLQNALSVHTAPDEEEPDRNHWKPGPDEQEVSVPWISIEWVRPMTSI